MRFHLLVLMALLCASNACAAEPAVPMSEATQQDLKALGQLDRQEDDTFLKTACSQLATDPNFTRLSETELRAAFTGKRLIHSMGPHTFGVWDFYPGGLLGHAVPDSARFPSVGDMMDRSFQWDIEGDSLCLTGEPNGIACSIAPRDTEEACKSDVDAKMCFHVFAFRSVMFLTWARSCSAFGIVVPTTMAPGSAWPK